MKSDLRQKTVSSMIWNFIQRFGTSGLSFVTNIILARLLGPDDFGCVGMLIIFISLSETFIDGGFASALIQKKKATNEDYSTIFFWNLFVSFSLFVLLQFSAPSIADFYNMPKLVLLLRVMSMILLINGFSVLHTTILVKQLSFKALAKINIIAVSIGMFVSIIAAYCGWGIWSLVLKTLLTGIITAILLWITNNWRPNLVFSWKSFRELFNFGGLLLLSTLIQTLFENIQGLIIGKYYSARDLGFYSQAKGYAEIPSKTLYQVVTQVSFPVFSQLSDNIEYLRNAVRKNIICTTYIIFPLNFMLIAIAKPLFVIVLTEKWIESVPYFQIICIYSLFVSLNAINTNIYKGLGKSKVYFWVQLSKRVIGIVLLIIGMQFGVKGITWSISISGILWWILAAAINDKILNYGLISQVKDVSSQFVVSMVIGLLVYVMYSFFSFSYFVSCLIGVAAYIVLYIFVSSQLGWESYKVYKNIILSYTKRI